MTYRAVNDRCLINFYLLQFPIPSSESLAILKRKGFREEKIDIVELARSLVGQSTYRRGARLREAPTVFDCSSLTKWLYGQIGVWLPRRSIQQRECGTAVELSEIQPGDLIFTTGRVDRYIDDLANSVGHVGMATSDTTIVHAANKRIGIIESSIEAFIKDSFRGVRRIAKLDQSITLRLPKGREVETSDDIKWIILQSFRS